MTEHINQNNTEKIADRKSKRRKNIFDWYQDLKATFSCMECGEDEPVCLEFHHRDQNSKINEVSNMARTGCGKATILAEIEKCDLLCANCHRKKTFPHLVRKNRL